MGIFYKQPSEIETFSIDFTDRIGALESISSYTVVIKDSSNIDVSSTMIVANSLTGNVVSSRIQGGTNLQSYTIVFTIVTNIDTYIEIQPLYVKDGEYSSVTARQVFNLAMALIDEMSSTGTIDVVKTASYAGKTPSILTVGQAELLKTGRFYNAYTLSITASTTDLWVEIEMPEDFEILKEILSEEVNGTYEKIANYKWENKTLLIPGSYAGTLKIIYKPTMSFISSLDDTLTISGVSAVTDLMYFLVANLMLTENPSLSAYCSQKYDAERAISARPQPAAIEPIQDVYGGYDW